MSEEVPSAGRAPPEDRPTGARGWTTDLRCPACGLRHRATWPHASFPAGGKMAFTCPGGRAKAVLFVESAVWAESVEPGELLRRFHE